MLHSQLQLLSAFKHCAQALTFAPPSSPLSRRYQTAGAYGCTISGAGPTAVAVVPDPEVGGRVAEAMGAAFIAAGLEVNSSKVVALDPHGAKFV